MRGAIRAIGKLGKEVVNTNGDDFDLAYKKVDMNLKTQDVAYQQEGLRQIAGSLREIRNLMLKKEENVGNDLLGIRQLLDEIRNLQRENY